MAAMLCDVVVVVRTHPQGIPLAICIMRQAIRWFCMSMGLRFTALNTNY